MNEKRFSLRPLMLALIVLPVLILVSLLLIPQSTAADDQPPASEAGSVPQPVLASGCELLQTFTYSRCEHTVTRRVTAPAELVGKNLREVEALYPEWRVTAIAPALVTMEQRPELFCPDHLVVMPGDGGKACVFENKYGDALALVRELEVTLDQLPAAVREEIEHGIGFSTAEELEMWLESVES